MNDWLTRLATLLRELTGGEVTLANPASAGDPASAKNVIWWKYVSGQPPLTVWIGMEDVAASALLGKILGADVPTDELKRQYRGLLERLEGKGELSDQGPSGPEIESVELQCSGMEPLRLYFAVGESSAWSNLEVLKDIELPVTLRFGTTRMTLQDLTGLSTGSVIEFDGGLNDPVEVLVNGRVIARGEAVIVQDSYAVRISEIASPPDRITFQREA